MMKHGGGNRMTEDVKMILAGIGGSNVRDGRSEDIRIGVNVTRRDVDGIRRDVAGLKQDMAEVKSDVSELRPERTEITSETKQ